MRSKAEKEEKKAHNVLSFLRTFSRKGVEFICKHAITAKSCETHQYREGFRTKMGDLIAHTGIFRVTKEDHRAKEKA